MKRLLFCCLALLAAGAQAGPPYSAAVDTGALSTSYVTASMSSISGSHAMFTNGSNVEVCCDTQALTVPSASDGHELCIPPSSIKGYDAITINGSVWCRNTSANAGTLMVELW